MRPLSICFVNFTRRWGGVRTWSLDFGRALRERGHRVTVILRPGTPFEGACRAVGFEVHAFRPGPKYEPLSVLRAARILRRARADVAVVNIDRDLTVGAVAARLLGIPVLHRVGLVEDFRRTAVERLRHRLLVDAILVPAAWMREALLGALPWLGPEEVHAIPNSKRLAPSVPRNGRRPGPAVFGTTSQLSPSKGHTLLFQALEGLRREGVPFRLRIAGTGPLEPMLRAEVSGRGLAEAVEFCGFLGDVGAFLGGLDAFVLPSLSEGFPNSLLEALSVGLPVAAFDLPGCREMAEGAGLLVPVGQVGPLADAVRALALDGGLRSRLGAAARARVEERYDLARNAERLEELLGKVARR